METKSQGGVATWPRAHSVNIRQRRVVEAPGVLEVVRPEFESWFCHLIGVIQVKLPKLSEPHFPENGVDDTCFVR